MGVGAEKNRQKQDNKQEDSMGTVQAQPAASVSCAPGQLKKKKKNWKEI